MGKSINALEDLLDILLVSAPRNSACRVDEDTIAQSKMVNQIRMLNKCHVVLLTNFVPIGRLFRRVLPLGSIQKVGKDLVTTLYSIELIKKYAPKEVTVSGECDTFVPKDRMVNKWD